MARENKTTIEIDTSDYVLLQEFVADEAKNTSERVTVPRLIKIWVNRAKAAKEALIANNMIDGDKKG